MQIYSNLNEYDQSIYSSYVSERYGSVWHSLVQDKIVQPVMKLSDFNRLFDLDVHPNVLPPIRIISNSFIPTCDFEGPKINSEQFKLLGSQYNITYRKTYVDLSVALNLFYYNNYLSDKLVLLQDNMYDGRQLHQELKIAIENYSRIFLSVNGQFDFRDFSIDTNNYICYQELIDYLHYKGIKPQISFKSTINGKMVRGLLLTDDYSANFTETSYNIDIQNIRFK